MKSLKQQEEVYPKPGTLVEELKTFFGRRANEYKQFLPQILKYPRSYHSERMSFSYVLLLYLKDAQQNQLTIHICV